VNYVGHGSVEVWQGGLFDDDDARALTNYPELSFFINMTCLNGFFQAPYAESLAEVLLKSDQGGAIAVWASSGLTYPQGQFVMNQELMRLLFNGEELTIGEATRRAKEAVSDQDVRRTWILFGDPVTSLATTITTKTSPCIAERLYGEDSEEVEFLRYTRDNILNKTSKGRKLIKLYYQWSPVIFETMEGDEKFKEEMKKMLDRVLLLIEGEVK
jgi:hypothetical protein